MRRFSILFTLLTLGFMVNVSEGQQPTEVPEEIQAEMAYLVGQWDYIAIENGKKFEGRYTARWAPGKQGLWLTFESEIHNDFGVSAWDPKTGEMVENWYGPTEGRLVLRYRIESESKWLGTAKNMRPDGTVSEGNIEVQKIDKNNFRYVKDADGQDMDIKMRRIVRKSDEHLASLDAFAGDWVAEKKGGGKTTWTFAWDETGKLLNNQMTSYTPSGEIDFILNAFVGWNEENQQMTNWGRLGNGSPIKFYWTKLEDGSWQSKNEAGDRTWIFAHKDGKFHSTETSKGTSTTTVYSRK